MKTIKLHDILPDLETVESYLTYQQIRDWCEENIPQNKWKFEYATQINAYGVDIPDRIFFWVDADADAFTSKHCVHPITPA